MPDLRAAARVHWQARWPDTSFLRLFEPWTGDELRGAAWAFSGCGRHRGTVACGISGRKTSGLWLALLCLLPSSAARLQAQKH